MGTGETGRLGTRVQSHVIMDGGQERETATIHLPDTRVLHVRERAVHRKTAMTFHAQVSYFNIFIWDFLYQIDYDFDYLAI